MVEEYRVDKVEKRLVSPKTDKPNEIKKLDEIISDFHYSHQLSNISDYDHNAVVDELKRTGYFTDRRQLRAVLSAQNRNDLINLAYGFKEENPSLAMDIFTEIRYEKGKQEMKPILFGSQDYSIHIYNLEWASKQGIETLREYASAMHENIVNPFIAFGVAEKVKDYQLAKKAMEILRKEHPEEARRLAPKYNQIRKTPIPAENSAVSLK